MSRRITALLAAVITLLAATLAAAQTKVIAGERLTKTATVEAIEMSSRRVTLRTQSGEIRTIYVPSDVTKLDGVKAGMTVSVTYYENLIIRVKKPGDAMEAIPTELTVVHDPKGEMDPYERLLGEAMEGDPLLFAREDGVEAAWAVVDPLIRDGMPVHEYACGSWGPLEADRLAVDVGGWTTPAVHRSASVPVARHFSCSG